MTIPNEMMKDIQDRIELLLNTSGVKEKMVDMHFDGKTDDEIQYWLTMCAVGTLMGVQHVKA